jgi:DNA-binding MarR family transcriptional regulator
MNARDLIALVGRVRESAHRLIQAELDRRGMSDLSPSHGAILDALFSTRRVTMTGLAEEIGRDKSTVTILVRKLERHGYVKRHRDPLDGRATHIELTPSGRALEPAFREISNLLVAKSYKGFTSQRKKELVDSLAQVRRNLEAV